MNWFQSRDATNSFRETVQVGREGRFYHEVTIYYYNRGRGEFEVTDGGSILWDQPDRGDRRLGVQTKYGNTFQIIRRHRGGYDLNTCGFWIRELERTYYY